MHADERESHQRHFEAFVLGPLHDFHEGIRPWYREKGNAEGESLSYSRAHFARFTAIVDLVKSVGHTPKRALEVGSFYPYTTIYWGCEIDLLDILPRICPTAKPYDVQGVRLIETNICSDPFPDKKYDLVVLSEVMEHIPVNLFEFEKKVIAVLDKGGVLITTYPMGGHNPKDYDKVVGDPNHSYDEHLREFTNGTIPLFFRDLKRIARADITYPAYGHIALVAYRKE